MPRRPRSPCTADPSCPELVDRPGPCAKHRSEREARRRRDEQWQDYGPGWRTLKTRVLLEEPRCRQCGSPSSDIDHIRPLRDGGAPRARANLQALCRSCHSRKTARENNFGGNRE